MAVVVNAGQFVKATVTVANIGDMAGTFRVRGSIFDPISGLPVSFFYPTTGYSGANPAPSGLEWNEITVNPGKQVTLELYSELWANGDRTMYPAGKLFNVKWVVMVPETGQRLTKDDLEVIQHQFYTLEPGRAEIIDVVYSVVA